MTSRRELGRFLALTFGLSWILWGGVAALRPPLAVGMLLVLLGGAGPSLAGLWLTRRSGDPAAWRELVARIVDRRRIGPAWWLFILLGYPAIAVAAALLNRAVGGDPVGLDWATVGDPIKLVGLAAVLIYGGPVSEEIGWRGYAQDRLAAITGPVGASLVLGPIWAAWHLPLFLIPETSQGAMGLGTTAFWLWTASVLAKAFLFTWVWNNTGRSVLAAIVLHFAANATFTLTASLGGKLPDSFEAASLAVEVVVAVTIVGLWRAGPVVAVEPGR